MMDSNINIKYQVLCSDIRYNVIVHPYSHVLPGLYNLLLIKLFKKVQSAIWACVINFNPFIQTGSMEDMLASDFRYFLLSHKWR